jgi:hypothetical protein
MSLLFSSSAGAENSGELAAVLGLSKVTVSHHLAGCTSSDLIGEGPLLDYRVISAPDALRRPAAERGAPVGERCRA